MSMNIIDTMCKNNPNTNIYLHEKLLNGFVNFKKYIEKVFNSEISKQNIFSIEYRQFKNGNYTII